LTTNAEYNKRFNSIALVCRSKQHNLCFRC